MLVWLLAIILHIIPPLASVIIFERLRRCKLSIQRRVMLYLFSVISTVIAGYAVMWIRGWVYPDWLILELLLPLGLLKRMVIPFASAIALPFAVYSIRVILPPMFKFVSSVVINPIVKLISSVVLPCIALLYRKVIDSLSTEEDFDSKLIRQYGHCTLVIFTFLFITFIFSPSYLAVGALEVLSNTVLMMVTLIISGASLLLGCIVFLLRRGYKYVEGLLTGLLLLCFLNSFVIPFQAEVLDGRSEFLGISDNPYPLIRNILVFLVFAGVSTRFKKQLRFTAVPLLIIAVVFTTSNLITIHNRHAGIGDDAYSQEELFESATTFSAERNVIVIVMDMFQGTVVEQMISEYPEVKDSYDGFTLFTRAFSSFPGTSYSCVAIQSGWFYSPGYDRRSDIFQLSFADSFMTDMRDDGARVNLIGRIPQVSQQDLFPYTIRITPQRPWGTYSSVSAASLARLTGYWIDSPFGIITDDNAIARDWEGGKFSTVIGRQVDSVELTEELIERLSVSDERENLLYMWNYGTHTPLNFSKDGQLDATIRSWTGATAQAFADEAYFFMTQLAKLFDAMKELDVYDNSLIIIVSDHGTSFSEEAWLHHIRKIDGFEYGDRSFGNWRKVYMFNPVLMVKPPNSRGQAIVTQDVVWNGDTRALIEYYRRDNADMPPIDVVAGIRALNPEVGVIFVPEGTSDREATVTTEHHEVLYVTSLCEIPEAFAAHTGASLD